jgi:hypothetical protein
VVSADGSDRMVALRFKIRSLATVRHVLQAAGVPVVQAADGAIVVPHEQACDVALAVAEQPVAHGSHGEAWRPVGGAHRGG